MTRQRKQLLNLFQQNTGKNKMVMKPYVPVDRNRPFGHQKPRMDKFRWQGRME